MKDLKGGTSYGDMCSTGNNDICAQYGLECGLYIGRDNSVGEWQLLDVCR
ncbi:hypothetical protein [uncultured Chryseobacterium sp.]|nr:hypothetical protein [uncultured Chryseobacterium sp.]